RILSGGAQRPVAMVAADLLRRSALICVWIPLLDPGISHGGTAAVTGAISARHLSRSTCSKSGELTTQLSCAPPAGPLRKPPRRHGTVLVGTVRRPKGERCLLVTVQISARLPRRRSSVGPRCQRCTLLSCTNSSTP